MSKPDYCECCTCSVRAHFSQAPHRNDADGCGECHFCFKPIEPGAARPSPLEFYPDLTAEEIKAATSLSKAERDLILGLMDTLVEKEPRPIVLAAFGGLLVGLIKVSSAEAGAPMSEQAILKMFANLSAVLRKK